MHLSPSPPFSSRVLQTQQLFHPVSQMCMEGRDKTIVMDHCQKPPSDAQRWTFQHHYTPNPNRIKG